RQTAGALVLILLSLTGMVWIAVALRQIELMTTQGQDVMRFLAMTTLAIPSMMALIAPIALLIASIHVLNRLSSDSELIVMTAGRGHAGLVAAQAAGHARPPHCHRHRLREPRGGPMGAADTA